MTTGIWRRLNFRGKEDLGGGGRVHGLPGDEAAPNATDDKRAIRCRVCRLEITTPSDRVAVNGAHKHTFANPHGLVFEIGCFGAVRHCGYVGEPTDEFTWFPGYRWRIVFCGRCLTHLGWVFLSTGRDSFHGLILNRLEMPA